MSCPESVRASCGLFDDILPSPHHHNVHPTSQEDENLVTICNHTGSLLLPQVDLFIDMHSHSTSQRSFMFASPPGGARGSECDEERVMRLPR
eukprot:365756-Chlamydomonas_euryale.AAC.2